MTDTLVRLVKERIRLHGNFLDSAMAGLDRGARQELDAYIRYCASDGFSLEYLAECYALVVRDTQEAQLDFIRTKKYRHSTFAEVEQSVYANPRYMEQYMLGLALTAFFWPNHLQIMKFFKDSIPKDAAGSYLEIGPGHGWHFLKSLEMTAYDSFLAVDISPKSVELAGRLAAHFIPQRASRAQLLCCDFLEHGFEDAFDAVVMGGCWSMWSAQNAS